MERREVGGRRGEEESEEGNKGKGEEWEDEAKEGEMKESKEMKAEGDADRETGGKCSAAWQYKILLARAIAEKGFLYQGLRESNLLHAQS